MLEFVISCTSFPQYWQRSLPPMKRVTNFQSWSMSTSELAFIFATRLRAWPGIWLRIDGNEWYKIPEYLAWLKVGIWTKLLNEKKIIPDDEVPMMIWPVSISLILWRQNYSSYGFATEVQNVELDLFVLNLAIIPMIQIACNWILFAKWKKASTGRVCVCKRLYTENLESSWYQLVRHMLFQHNAADKKWAPFGRRQLQMHSLEWKCLNFGYKFTEVCSQGTNWQNTSTDSDNGLVLNRQQAIIWTNGGLCCDATRPEWINDNLLCHQWRKSYITTILGF